MNLTIFQVAAFTEQMFGGNPAAVIPLDKWLDDGVMQRIAAENNLSETAFFVPVADNEWQIRWFTPAVEVPLCGHATLASAAVIHQKLQQNVWPITLQSASGPLSVDIDGDAYTLNLPASKPELVDIPEGLETALGCEISELLLGRDIYVAVLADQASVAALQPDFTALAKLIEHGITVTAAGTDVDFVSRFFAPAIGIDEDPVTGAAHCVLTPFWSERLGKKSLRAQQISSRVGELTCEDLGERVLLQGHAVFFLSGTINTGAQ
jgi:PhzF family phenazine biosynthesis protein